MAVTPVGNPYVESSDLVANYPGASEALAERIDIVGVNPFADSAARATAIPSPTEGMMSSLNDTDAVQRYDGAMWKPVGGKVLQVVSTVKTNRFTTTSGTLTDITDYAVTITPSATSSKIMVMSTFHYSEGSVGPYAEFLLLRDSTILTQGDSSGSADRVTASNRAIGAGNVGDVFNVGFNFVDSPSSTSALIYKWQVKTHSSRAVVFNGTYENTNAVSNQNTSSTIIVMEISA